jgi:hypothetical protein
MIAFIIFAALVGGGVFWASQKGLFAGLAGAKWGLAPGEKMIDMFTIAKSLRPLTSGESRAMTVANVVGIFAGFQVGREIELMTMVVTDRRVIWAQQYGQAQGPRIEFSAATPAMLTVRSVKPEFRPDGVHQSRIVTLSAGHLQQDFALVIPEKFLSAPPAYMTIVNGD